MTGVPRTSPYKGYIYDKIRASMSIKHDNGKTTMSILKNHCPVKYTNWIKKTVMEAGKQNRKQRDSAQNSECVPDYNI